MESAGHILGAFVCGASIFLAIGVSFHLVVRRYWLACLLASTVSVLGLTAILWRASGWTRLTIVVSEDRRLLTVSMFVSAAAAFLAGLPVLGWRRSQEEEALAAKVMCRQCEYDLRGTIKAGRTACPECGTPIER